MIQGNIYVIVCYYFLPSLFSVLVYKKPVEVFELEKLQAVRQELSN